MLSIFAPYPDPTSSLLHILDSDTRRSAAAFTNADWPAATGVARSGHGKKGHVGDARFAAVRLGRCVIEERNRVWQREFRGVLCKEAAKENGVWVIWELVIVGGGGCGVVWGMRRGKGVGAFSNIQKSDGGECECDGKYFGYIDVPGYFLVFRVGLGR